MLESLRLNLFGTAESAGASDRSGPGLFSGYYRDDASTAARMRGGTSDGQTAKPASKRLNRPR